MEVGVAECELGFLRPAGVELHVVLLGEADGAVDLVAGGADAAIGLADPCLGYRYVLLGGCALRELPGCLSGYVTAAFDVARHVGAVVLHGLEGPDWTAELDSLLGVLDRHVQDSLGAADHLRALGRRSPQDHLFDRLPASVHLSKHRRLWYGHVLQDDLGLAVGCDGLQERLAHAVRAFRNEEEGNVARGASGPRRHDDLVGNVGVGCEELGAIEQVPVAGCGRGRLHSLRPPAGGRLEQGEGHYRVTVGDGRQQLFLLLLAARLHDRHASHHDRGEEWARQHRRSGLLQEDREIEERQANAAVPLRDDESEPPLIGDLLPELRRESALIKLHLAH